MGVATTNNQWNHANNFYRHGSIEEGHNFNEVVDRDKKVTLCGIVVSVPVVVCGVLAGLCGLFIGLACLIGALHRVHEGHVGVYYKYGALMKEMSGPGVHWMQPFVTSIVQIKVTPETKVLNPMVCTTRDGVRNVFRDVQVITSVEEDHVWSLVKRFSADLKTILVYDRVRESIQRFCANNSIDEVYNTRFLDIVDYVNISLASSLERLAPKGLVLWNFFLPKPDVPPAISANYRQVKVEWTLQLVAKQKQITEKIKKETETIKAVLDAERAKTVKAILTEQRILEETGEANMTRIKNQVFEETERMKADVSSYVIASEAESNQKLLTDNYVKLNLAKSLGNNTKMYFSGPDSVLGSIMGQVFKNNNNQ